MNYLETFSPIVQTTTVRCVIAMAASKHWKLYQLDVNNIFLHGDLREEVYMKPHEGLHYPPSMVCKLKKSLDGLKQASHNWFARLHTKLVHLGFQQSNQDYSLSLKLLVVLLLSLPFTLMTLLLRGMILPQSTTLKLTFIRFRPSQFFSWDRG